MQPEQHETLKKHLHKFNKNPNFSGSSIAQILKLPKSTVNYVIKRYNDFLTFDQAPGRGRKVGPVDNFWTQKVLKSIRNNPGLSIRDQTKKFKTSASNNFNIRSRHGYKSIRAIKQPNRNDKQNLVAKNGACRLYDEVLTKFDRCILMDDQTYVKIDLKQLSGQKYCSATIRGNVTEKFKYVLLDEYAKKGMI